MSIHINNICKSFFGKKVLESITFKANPGDIVGLLGPNGAGKSTLMKIISGYYEQTSGEIKICNEDTIEKRLITKQKMLTRG